MKVDLSFNLNTEDCFDVQDILYELREEVVKQILNNIQVGSLRDGLKLIDEQCLDDPEIKKLIKQRKDKLMQELRRQIQEEIS